MPYEPDHAKTRLRAYADSKGPDQPARSDLNRRTLQMFGDTSFASRGQYALISPLRILLQECYSIYHRNKYRFIYHFTDLTVYHSYKANWVYIFLRFLFQVKVQSTFVISNSKGLSEIFRDIRTSTYQICRIEEKIIRTTTFSKYICNWTLVVRDILKILWKRGEIASFFLPVVRFSRLGRDQIFTLR